MIDRIAGGQIIHTTNSSNSVQGDTNIVKAAEPIFLQEEKREQLQENYPKEKLQKVIESMNQFVQASNKHLKFELHDQLNEYYVKIVDDKTQEVIKEIPSKKMLDIFAEMEKHLGLLVDKKI
ncbi:flagellar protein FlaG [Heyndrickxia camelliae]|uniref:Flagellar biosynthesis protein FlaG n=1 Tax=Heyndrickxia camelliae TaxID=1707093 RepID=A0A2N3LNQ9_9BACI|nr:flagellar protein FlaG [Heyndrickxia camelliae]PKR86270.1 flagellar biosynthesis protein FlaG [Heyndrickxia camelliae]